MRGLTRIPQLTGLTVVASWEKGFCPLLTGNKFDRRRCERDILDLEIPLPNRAKNSDNSAEDFPFTGGQAN